MARHQLSVSDVARLTGLTSLDVGNNDLGSKGVAALAPLTELRDLGVSFNDADDESIARCAVAMKSLVKLRCTWNRPGGRAGRAIASLAALASLHVAYSEAHLFADSLATVQTLTELDATSAGIGPDAAAPLSRLAGLRKLSLANNDLGSEGAAALARGPVASGLTSLDVSWNSIGYRGAVEMAETMASLSRLNIRHNAILDVGVRALARLPALVDLDASHNFVSESTVRYVKKIRNFCLA